MESMIIDPIGLEKDNNGNYIPLIASSPIEIYKLIRVQPNINELASPFYQNLVWEINKENFSKLEQYKNIQNPDHNVSHGLHAYVDRFGKGWIKENPLINIFNYWIDLLTHLITRQYPVYFKVFKGIIPENSNYFTSSDWHIVSDRMIIIEEVVSDLLIQSKR